MTPNDEKRARLIEASAALLMAAPGHRMYTVSLNKGLFYLDLVSLRDRGTTFTQNTYIALPMGPVVAKYPKRLIGALQEEGVAKQEIVGLANPVTLIKAPTFDWADDEIREIAKKVSQFCSKRTTAQVSDYSHENPGWLMAIDGPHRASGVKKPIDMYIAMQQIVDDDTWMNGPLDEASIMNCNEADHLVGQMW